MIASVIFLLLVGGGIVTAVAVPAAIAAYVIKDRNEEGKR